MAEIVFKFLFLNCLFCLSSTNLTEGNIRKEERRGPKEERRRPKEERRGPKEGRKKRTKGREEEDYRRKEEDRGHLEVFREFIENSPGKRLFARTE